MSSLSAVGRPAAARKNDRVSLCKFTFSDGRRCRNPRTGKNPHFCFDHAQKEARAQAAETLGKDLAYFFSGNYLSACDLSTALARLIPAVVRGDVKPKIARTVAYMAQTLLQTIHISEDEYINAFGMDGWRKSIRNSVKGNYDYRFPPDSTPEPLQSSPPTTIGANSPASPQPTQTPKPAEPPVNCHSGAVAQAFRPEESVSSSNSSLATRHSSLAQPLPLTGAEFVQHVVAGLQTGSFPATPHVQPAPANPRPAETVANCHSERSEEPASSSNSSLATHHSPLPQTPAPSPAPAQVPQAPASPSSHVCHPGGTEGSHPIPATQPAPSVAPTPQPACPEQGRRANPREPNRDAPWLNYSPTSNIPPDSKLL